MTEAGHVQAPLLALHRRTERLWHGTGAQRGGGRRVADAAQPVRVVGPPKILTTFRESPRARDDAQHHWLLAGNSGDGGT